MKKILLIISIILLCFSCKKIEKQAMNGGKIIYKSENYSLKNARCSNFGNENIAEPNRMNLFFASSSINMNEDAISGTGTILTLATFSLSDSLQEGVYNVEDFIFEKNIVRENSFLSIITKEDTITIEISGGYMLVKNHLQVGKYFEFHFVSENGDSITGNFSGAPLNNLMYDKPVAAQISVDTIDYQVQTGDLVCWGKLLSNELYYYEIYFYSINLRRTDAGKIKNGFVLILGIHSLSEFYPKNGTYQIIRSNENNTLLWGTKISNGRWGTYWTCYKNSSSSATSNIISGKIEFEKLDNCFKITMNLKDQNNNLIKGEYDNILNIKKIY